VDRGFKQRFKNIDDMKFFDFKELNNLNNSVKHEGTVVVYCYPKEEVDCKRRPCVNSCCNFGLVTDEHDVNACKTAVCIKVFQNHF